MLAAGACTGGGASPPADLGDPAVLDRLGVAGPDARVWQRSVGAIEVVGTTSRAVPSELDLLAAAAADVPAAVWESAGLRTIVRAADLGSADLEPETAAFSRGPDIYLIDRTFRDPRVGGTRLSMTRVLLHELAHVAQFNALTEDYVEAVLAGDITDTDTSNGSALVADFAEATGWENRGSDPFNPIWVLPSGAEGTTRYGATSPDEDMAESLAEVALGRDTTVSEDRIRWIEEWLGVGRASLARGMPWIPDGAVRAFFTDAVYDEARVASLRPAHVEPEYWELPEAGEPGERLADRIGSELRNRALTGRLDRTDDPRLPRFAGLFRRSDGAAFWVELWDFREATGIRGAPPRPVLTYVMLW